MVKARRGLVFWCCGLALLACNAASSEPPGLVLSGFQLVDVEAERVERRDVVIEAGALSALAPDVALSRGYVRVDVTAKEWRADLRAMESVAKPDAACNTLASFVVADGKPGPVKV